jgi:hypothetical protein
VERLDSVLSISGAKCNQEKAEQGLRPCELFFQKWLVVTRKSPNCQSVFSGDGQLINHLLMQSIEV